MIQSIDNQLFNIFKIIKKSLIEKASIAFSGCVIDFQNRNRGF